MLTAAPAHDVHEGQVDQAEPAGKLGGSQNANDGAAGSPDPGSPCAAGPAAAAAGSASGMNGAASLAADSAAHGVQRSTQPVVPGSLFGGVQASSNRPVSAPNAGSSCVAATAAAAAGSRCGADGPSSTTGVLAAAWASEADATSSAPPCWAGDCAALAPSPEGGALDSMAQAREQLSVQPSSSPGAAPPAVISADAAAEAGLPSASAEEEIGPRKELHATTVSGSSLPGMSEPPTLCDTAAENAAITDHAAAEPTVLSEATEEGSDTSFEWQAMTMPDTSYSAAPDMPTLGATAAVDMAADAPDQATPLQPVQAMQPSATAAAEAATFIGEPEDPVVAAKGGGEAAEEAADRKSSERERSQSPAIAAELAAGAMGITVRHKRGGRARSGVAAEATNLGAADEAAKTGVDEAVARRGATAEAARSDVADAATSGADVAEKIGAAKSVDSCADEAAARSGMLEAAKTAARSAAAAETATSGAGVTDSDLAYSVAAAAEEESSSNEEHAFIARARVRESFPPFLAQCLPALLPMPP